MATVAEVKNAKWKCGCGSTVPWKHTTDKEWERIAASDIRRPMCNEFGCYMGMTRQSWHCATLDEALGCAVCIGEANRERAQRELERIGKSIMDGPVFTAFPEPKPLTILEEAGSLVNQGGDRNDAYDHPRHNFGKIATVWSTIFGIEVTTRQVALAMIGVKLVRDSHKGRRDNLVDIAGYARCAERLDEPLD